jgi:hypothetical protein
MMRDGTCRRKRTRCTGRPTAGFKSRRRQSQLGSSGMITKTTMGLIVPATMLLCLNFAHCAETKGDKAVQKDNVSSPAGTTAAGTATGTLVINPKSTFEKDADEFVTFNLNNVRVQSTVDPFDKKKNEIRIVLSDLPVSDADMKDENAVVMLVQTGKLHAIELFLTSAGKPAWGKLLYKMQSRSIDEETFTFERKTFDAKTVAGKISAEKRDIFTKKPIYTVTATFSAPVLH